MPAVDIFQGTDDIQEKAAGNGFSSHWEYDTALRDLVTSAYDGHWAWSLCSTEIFEFGNEVPLVSISSDGLALPEVYTFEDAAFASNNSGNVSPVVSINGQDVATYLEAVSLTEASQDRDALYNFVFYSNPISVGGAQTGEDGHWLGLFSSSESFWPGAYQTLHFKNGTSRVVDTNARYPGKWTYKSGQALLESKCLPESVSSVSPSSTSAIASTSAPSSSSATPSPTTSTASSQSTVRPVPSSYPKPFGKTDNNYLLSFFPETESLKDYGILAVPSFEVSTTEEVNQFEARGREFVNNATAKGKTKIIIDIQGNGGGTIATGQNLFRLFFPDVPVYSAVRVRSGKAFNLIGKSLSKEDVEGAPFDWSYEITPDQKDDFSSWEDFAGPHDILGVNSTSLFSYNFTQQSYPGGSPISGYGKIPLNPKNQGWAAEDIILLTDGICASTCTIFSELMKAQGVRTIAFGGRPIEGPMQGMGGIKGAAVLPLDGLNTLIEVAEYLIKNGTSPLSKEEIEIWSEFVPVATTQMPFKLSSASVNIFNAFSQTNDRVPRQYVYEAAECRRFYTYDNLVHQETTWASAADAMFNGGACVQGSMNATGSLFSKGPSSRDRLAAAIASHFSGH
ncbi:hypothetical protein N7456_003094 [Penicillium angulare]|uniref:Tail specific protease domain-containing protein n=1 Tax=Penicillium angulare TaxID=116970 RepID=A0A9W9FU41_9EURO|nr:hypothetical protein N7456_003094 [Penicillium angulare]